MAPTDATAVDVLAGALPRRQVTLLRAESLVDDGTALVVYGLAVGITVGDEHLSVPHVGGLFLLAYGGGAPVGAAVAWGNTIVRHRRADPLPGNLVMHHPGRTPYAGNGVLVAGHVPHQRRAVRPDGCAAAVRRARSRPRRPPGRAAGAQNRAQESVRACSTMPWRSTSSLTSIDSREATVSPASAG
ncbi:hypothetical protein ACFV2H_18330 [Streptomyces sp. NPDC059629]|uniref:hypothetical protein n=1 Tax=Streptomyces sp. NPDC059629 TaxID=3346889 RepID=UPI003695594A